ncbi:MAG TPA: glycosyltransferase family 4 protein, partial [Anaerolineales bacterium]|nr:glycosyltransferase family 4 protein [Anaerolineales bacterium]
RWDALYFPWNSAAIAYHALSELAIPVIVSCRGSQVNVRPHTPGNEAFMHELRASLQQAAAVHCVSADILQEATKYGLDPARASVIRPAVDPGFFLPPTSPPASSRLVIITTGALTWLKGHEYDLLALRQLLDLGVEAEFHIIGAGPERQRVLYTIQDLALEGRVILHGKLPSAEVRDQLQAADVFLLASHSEGIANAALEAMSCGLPVVTTDCGGMREAVTDGVEGFVVPARDPAAMADALLRLAQDPALRLRMGQAARARVLRDFDLKDQIIAFTELMTAAQAGS